MLGCQNMTAFAATPEPLETLSSDHLAMIVSGDACASTQSHDCCAKKQAEAKTRKPLASAKSTVKPSLQTAALMSQTVALSPEPLSDVTECPLALSRAVAVSKTSSSKEVVPLVASPLAAHAVENSRERQHSLFPLSRLPNLGHTYLRCCVFLI